MTETHTLLKSYADRLVRLHEERAGLASDISDVLKEAHGSGFDKPALKAVVKRLMNDSAQDDAEKAALIETYWAAYQQAIPAPARARVGQAA